MSFTSQSITELKNKISNLRVSIGDYLVILNNVSENIDKLEKEVISIKNDTKKYKVSLGDTQKDMETIFNILVKRCEKDKPFTQIKDVVEIKPKEKNMHKKNKNKK